MKKRRWYEGKIDFGFAGVKFGKEYVVEGSGDHAEQSDQNLALPEDHIHLFAAALLVAKKSPSKKMSDVPVCLVNYLETMRLSKGEKLFLGQGYVPPGGGFPTPFGVVQSVR